MSIDYWRSEAIILRRANADVVNELDLMRQLIDLQKLELAHLDSRFSEQSTRTRQLLGCNETLKSMDWHQLTNLEDLLMQSLEAVRSAKEETFIKLEKRSKQRTCVVCLDAPPDTVLLVSCKLCI